MGGRRGTRRVWRGAPSLLPQPPGEVEKSNKSESVAVPPKKESPELSWPAPGAEGLLTTRPLPPSSVWADPTSPKLQATSLASCDEALSRLQRQELGVEFSAIPENIAKIWRPPPPDYSPPPRPSLGQEKEEEDESLVLSHRPQPGLERRRDVPLWLPPGLEAFCVAKGREEEHSLFRACTCATQSPCEPFRSSMACGCQRSG